MRRGHDYNDDEITDYQRGGGYPGRVDSGLGVVEPESAYDRNTRIGRAPKGPKSDPGKGSKSKRQTPAGNAKGGGGGTGCEGGGQAKKSAPVARNPWLKRDGTSSNALKRHLTK